MTFTPTEQRILTLLSDGLAHSKVELDRCVNDELAGSNTLSVHLARLRYKLDEVGQTILCNRRNGCVLYSHVRFISR